MPSKYLKFVLAVTKIQEQKGKNALIKVTFKAMCFSVEFIAVVIF